MAEAAPRILVVEDERIVALDLQHSLADLGFRVVACAASHPEAVQQALQHRPDLILMDINLGGGRDGVEAAADIGRHMDTPVVFLSAYAEPEMLQRAGRTAPYGYLVKPVELRELNATVRMALARYQATARPHQAERRLPLAAHAARIGHEDTVVGVRRDARRARRVAQNALARQAAVAFESAADAILVLDGQDRVLTANPAFTRRTGWAVDEIRGRHPNDFLHGSRSDDQALLGGQPPDQTGHAEVLCRTRDGATFPAWEHVAPVVDGAGRVVQRVLTFSDISALRQSDSRVHHLAYHDTLTGLGNRHQLEEALARLTASQAPQAVLFMDLDGFKTINDTLGHAAGDLLLKVVADRIRHCLRAGDQAVRLGGDEFVVLAQRSPVDDIGRLTGRVLDAVRQPVHLQGLQAIRISSSIGVALYPEDATTPQALLRAADVAMYAAKGSGRDSAARYSPRMSVDANERLRRDHTTPG